MTQDPPLPGRCSRCGQPALLTEDRWTHRAGPCQQDDSTAEFLPDPPLKDSRMHPTIGRIVHYTLNEADAKAINTRRSDFTAYGRTHVHPHRPGQPGATGHVAHVGNHASAGDICPAMVVRTFGTSVSTANLQVHLDGNDTYWATSRTEGEGEGRWTWPDHAPVPAAEAPAVARKPNVGDSVHYVSYGTPGGEYGKECRAATITEVSPESKGEGHEIVGLNVSNPTGFFFNRGCEHHEVPPVTDPHAPVPGGGALNHPGGTWHWSDHA